MPPNLMRKVFSIETLCAGLLVLLTVTMCAQVFSRYVLAMPFVWADEVVGLAFTWLTFLAAAVALKHRGHIAFTFFVDLAGANVRRALLGAVALGVIAFLGVVLVTGIQMTMLVHDQRSASLELPMSWYYAALPLGAALMLVYEMQHMLKQWRREQ